jgi:hypothetical protein
MEKNGVLSADAMKATNTAREAETKVAASYVTSELTSVAQSQKLDAQIAALTQEKTSLQASLRRAELLATRATTEWEGLQVLLDSYLAEHAAAEQEPTEVRPPF